MAELGVTAIAIGGHFQLDLHGKFSYGILEGVWESYIPKWIWLQNLPWPPCRGSPQGTEDSNVTDHPGTWWVRWDLWSSASAWSALLLLISWAIFIRMSLFPGAPSGKSIKSRDWVSEVRRDFWPQSLKHICFVT